ncbi:hypothetical protein SNEBB_005781 [Seison nebaliae]|nr:hypothetical protein SNEBB_005781 [Seison nebaliae]
MFSLKLENQFLQIVPMYLLFIVLILHNYSVICQSQISIPSFGINQTETDVTLKDVHKNVWNKTQNYRLNFDIDCEIHDCNLTDFELLRKYPDKYYDCTLDGCLNGGRCVYNEHLFRRECQCSELFHGIKCEKLTNIFETRGCDSYCKNGGVCNKLTCYCPPNYTGRHCETLITSCYSNPCVKAGTCYPTVFGGYICLCPPIYNGHSCEIKDYNGVCRNEPCRNGGICLLTQSGFECVCPKGFIGKYCEEINRGACVSHPCLNDGICHNNGSNYFCSCNYPYNGLNCEHNRLKEVCRSLPCKNDGVCVETVGKYTCFCKGPFTGYNCDTPLKPINPCESFPCLNGGSCYSSAFNFYCVCPINFEGNFCQKPRITICQQNPCENGGLCYPTLNDYVCRCSAQYTGKNCSTFLTTNFSCMSNPCMNGGTCFNNPNAGFVCKCNPNFTGLTCGIQSQMNVCASTPCKNQGTCVIIAYDRYICICPNTFTGQRCETSFIGNGCTINPCLNNGICTTYDGVNFHCMCLAPFSGERCETNVETQTSIAPPITTTYPFSLSTPDVLVTCLSQPCRNGGMCFPAINGYFCRCTALYTGKNCENLLNDPCRSKPCQNQGICTPLGSEFVCVCQMGFTGIFCENQMSPCNSVPCKNGGTCITTSINSFVCVCTSQFTSTLCEQNLNGTPINPFTTQPTNNDFCASNPCRNSGMCVANIPTDFGLINQCFCPKNYFGRFCQRDYCIDGRNCVNNGECIENDEASAYCKCLPNFSGRYCEVDTFCLSNNCLNGGTCNAQTRRCVCRSGYTGQSCETIVRNFCKPNKCKNGATCVSDNENFAGFCFCKDGTVGYYCEIVNDKMKSCFPNTSYATLANGSSESIDRLKFGEDVLYLNEENKVATTKFIGYLHYDVENRFKYLNISFRLTNQIHLKTIIISPKHLLKINGIYTQADTIKLNDTILYTESQDISNGIIVGIEEIDLSSAFAPLTTSGSILINNIQVSNYAMVNSHNLAHQVMEPYLWLTYFTSDTKWLQKVLNKYVHILERFTSILPFDL